MAERADVVERVAAHVGADRAWTAQVISDLRFVIDKLITDDVTVMAPPFVLRRSGDPVWARVRELLHDPGWEPPAALEALEPAELASLLTLDEQTVTDHPLAGESDLLRDLAALRDVDLDAAAEGDGAALTAAEALYGVMGAWLDLWGDEVPVVGEYRVSVVGLESMFESWLLRQLDQLVGFGFPVERVGDQVRFADGRRGDVLCRAVADSQLLRRGDFVMIENKAHRADVPALEQLLGYVHRCRLEKVEAGERVHGLLLADGVTVSLQERLRVERVHYVSLSALGYRDHLRGSPPALDLDEPDEPAVQPVVVETLPSVPRPRARELVATAHSGAHRRRRGPWRVGGATYTSRRQANRTLAAELGTYTPEQWREAQRRHGLR